MSSRLRAAGRRGSMCECGSMSGMRQISWNRSFVRESCSMAGVSRERNLTPLPPFPKREGGKAGVPPPPRLGEGEEETYPPCPPSRSGRGGTAFLAPPLRFGEGDGGRGSGLHRTGRPSQAGFTTLRRELQNLLALPD